MTDFNLSKQEQDLNFLSEFVAKFDPLIISLAYENSTSKDEIINIAYALVLSDDKFDEAKGDRFARTCFLLKHEVRNTFGYDYSVFNSIEISELEDTEAAEFHHDVEQWRSDELLQNMHIGGDIGKIVKCVLAGKDFEQCAEELGLTLRRVEQIAQQATARNANQCDLFAA